MNMISTNDALQAFCHRHQGAEYLLVDTEFMRESTYWPILCLVQLGAGGEYVAIDALAEGLDLAPVFAMMENPNILKVFHAARQDLEIFHHLSGKVPHPIFDTQVAAMVCGYGDSVGYATLAEELAGARIDKSRRFADWAQRPLRPEQVEYALADVIHLDVIFGKLRKTLAGNGRELWLRSEMAVLEDPGTYITVPEEAWQRFKLRSTKPRFLSVLRELAAWREREAQRRDMPRNRVLRDEALVEIAAHEPRTADDLARTRGLGRGLAEGRIGRDILAQVEKGLAVPDAERPRVPRRAPPPMGTGPVVELLRVLLKLKCEQNDVAPKLIATTDELQLIAADDEADVPALRGWRREMFGAAALELKHGKLGLAVRDREIVLVPLGGGE